MSKILLLLCALDATNAISYVPKAEANLGETNVQRHIEKTTVYTTGNQARGQTSTGSEFTGNVITANGLNNIAIGASGQPYANDYVKDATIGHLNSGCSVSYLAVHGARNTVDAAKGYDETAIATVNTVFGILGLTGKVNYDTVSDAKACHDLCDDRPTKDCLFFTYVTTGFAYEQAHGLCFLKGSDPNGNTCTDADYTGGQQSTADLGKISGKAGSHQNKPAGELPASTGFSAKPSDKSVSCSRKENMQYGSSLSGACSDAEIAEDGVFGASSQFLDAFLDQHHGITSPGAALDAVGKDAAEVADACMAKCKEVSDCHAWNYLSSNYVVGAFRNSCWLFKKINSCDATLGTGWPALDSWTGTVDSSCRA